MTSILSRPQCVNTICMLHGKCALYVEWKFSNKMTIIINWPPWPCYLLNCLHLLVIIFIFGQLIIFENFFQFYMQPIEARWRIYASIHAALHSYAALTPVREHITRNHWEHIFKWNPGTKHQLNLDQKLFSGKYTSKYHLLISTNNNQEFFFAKLHISNYSRLKINGVTSTHCISK